LIAARLLVVSEEAGGERRVEVIHEALLVAWPRLVAWRREDAEGARLRDQLRTAARQWDQRSRPKGLLWRGDALAEYRLWRARYPGAVTDVEDAFARASIADATRGRRIRRGLLVAAFAILAVGLTIMFQLRQRAEEQSSIAQARAKANHAQLVASFLERGQKELLDGNTDGALVYLNEAFQMGADSAALRFMIARARAPLDAERAELVGSDAKMDVAAVTSDGTRVVTTAQDGTVTVWDGDTGARIADLPRHAKGRVAAAWNSDGTRFATGDTSGLVRLWSRDGAPTVVLAKEGPPVFGLTFRSDGSYVAASTLDVPAPIRIWSVADRGAHSWPLHDPDRAKPSNEGFTGLDFDPVRARIATADQDGRVALWSIDGRLIAEDRGHQAPIWFARFDAGGARLATCGVDGTARIWDAETLRPLHVLREHRGRVTHVAFDPSGRRLATSGADRTIRIWDVESGRSIITLEGHTAQVNRASFVGGDVIASAGGDDSARLWDVRRGIQIAVFSHRGFVGDATSTADGRRLVTASWSGSAKIWNLDQRARLATFADGATGDHPAMSISGRTLTHVGPRAIVQWDIERATMRRRDAPPAVELVGVATARDGRTIVVGDATGALHLLSEPGARIVGRHDQRVDVVALDADGTAVASASAGTVALWDVTSGTQRANAEVIGGVKGLKLADASTVLVLGPMAAFVLDEHGIGPSLSASVGELLDASLSPDHRWVVVADEGGATVWTAAGQRVMALPMLRGAANPVAWTPGGDRIVAGGLDGSLGVWRASTWERIHTTRAHDNWLSAVAISDDGALFATTSADRTVAIWDAATLDRLASFGVADHPEEVAFVGDDRIAVSTALHTDVWNVSRYTGDRVALADFVRCKIPLGIVDGRLVATNRSCR
jgi:WD40 repeat protein